MPGSTQYRVNEPTVIQEIIDGEAIIANLGLGFYYSLDQGGSLVWSALVQGWSPVEIIEAWSLHDQGQRDEIETGVNALVTKLQDENLIVPAIGDAITPEGVIADFFQGNQVAVFETPKLNKYTDMEQLLLLDPVHDVDETGWPNAPDNTGD